MKKTSKFILLALLIITISVSFISCSKASKPNGTYVDNIGFSQLTFSGSKVESVHRGDFFSKEMDESTKQKGKFVIKDEQVIISWEDGGYDKYDYDDENDELIMGNRTVVFSKIE